MKVNSQTSNLLLNSNKDLKSNLATKKGDGKPLTKVESLKSQIESEDYKIDLNKVANEILNELIRR